MQYTNLKSHIKSHIGLNKKYDAIPIENLPQKRHTHSNTTSLLESIRKGSGLYRKIISREHTTPNIYNPAKWNKRLHSTQVTKNHIKNMLKNLHSPYIDSSTADHLSRLKLCRTLFNSQLFAINIIDSKSCKTCIREFNDHTDKDYKHASGKTLN